MRFIGCKTLLLDNIKEVIDAHAPDAKTFCDIFSGTSTVARHFKQWYEVISNDLLYFSYCLQMATIENDGLPSYSVLLEKCGIADPFEYFNSMKTEDMEALPVEKRFFQNNYAPVGGRMYVTDSNALRIDFARNMVEQWRNAGYLSDLEYYHLVAGIVEGIPLYRTMPVPMARSTKHGISALIRFSRLSSSLSQQTESKTAATTKTAFNC